jgi:hypothetical protein
MANVRSAYPIVSSRFEGEKRSETDWQLVEVALTSRPYHAFGFFTGYRLLVLSDRLHSQLVLPWREWLYT